MTIYELDDRTDNSDEENIQDQNNQNNQNTNKNLINDINNSILEYRNVVNDLWENVILKYVDNSNNGIILNKFHTDEMEGKKQFFLLMKKTDYYKNLMYQKNKLLTQKA